jgi:Mce-associated membrane protein
MDTDSAQVLVVADATITNTAAPDGQLRHYRIKLDMVRVGDAWLTAGLQAVG